MAKKKRDWVKISAIVLASLFFILWLISNYSYSEELELRQQCENDLIVQEKDHQNAIDNIANTINNTITDLSNVCEKYLLEYQAKYDCYERGYFQGKFIYDEPCITQTCESGYSLACVPN